MGGGTPLGLMMSHDSWIWYGGGRVDALSERFEREDAFVFIHRLE